MDIIQPPQEVAALVNNVRKYVKLFVSSVPQHLKVEVEDCLEDYGYEVIINYGLREKDTGYLMKCLQNRAKFFVIRARKKAAKIFNIEDIGITNPEDHVYTNMLDRMLMSFWKLKDCHKKLGYWVVVMVNKGSVRPVSDVAELFNISPMTVSKALHNWRLSYAREINHEVRQVRSLRHLQKLLYAGCGEFDLYRNAPITPSDIGGEYEPETVQQSAPPNLSQIAAEAWNSELQIRIPG